MKKVIENAFRRANKEIAFWNGLDKLGGSCKKINNLKNRFNLILARLTGCFAPGCKFNIESTDVLLSLSALKRRTNSDHPLCGR